MARKPHKTAQPDTRDTVRSVPLLPVGTYTGQNFITVNTALPTNPLLVDRSKFLNGRSAADYNQMFARLPKELEGALRSKGHVEVTITIDERGKVTRLDSGSAEATHVTYVSAMIRRNANGSNELVGIWGGRAGGGNNGAPAAMSTIKLMITNNGKNALAHTPILDAAKVEWGNAFPASSGNLSQDKRGWEFSRNVPSCFIPYFQDQSHGVRKQTDIGEHFSKYDNTWGCLSGGEESFRVRMNARIAIMMGPNPANKHDWGSGLGLQHSPGSAVKVFLNNKALAASTLGKIYHLNPLMYETGNPKYQALAEKLHVPHARVSPVSTKSSWAVNTVPAPKPSIIHEPVHAAPSRWNISLKQA